MDEIKFEYITPEFRYRSGKNHYYEGLREGKWSRMYGVTHVTGNTTNDEKTGRLMDWAVKTAVSCIEKEAESCFDREGEVVQPDWNDLLEKAKLAHTKKSSGAMDIGTLFHQWSEGYDKKLITGLPEDFQLNKMAQNYIDWKDKYVDKILEIEKKVGSFTYWVGGTMDRKYLMKDGKILTGDIKTSSGIYDVMPFVQCAAYDKLNQEMFQTKQSDGTVIVNIKKDGTTGVHYRYSIDEDWTYFLAGLTLLQANKSWTKSWKN